ncbi:hypothetical protein ACT3SP_12000 [Brachybacterium sp. AOP43-C2-M15]|uniref:hypothetical protein n=1 Tax=Brachybacterium sp. AOP43-C2-M15 TaxID=3457661 RepID=UPI004034995A
MRLRSLVDPIAETLLELKKVSSTQWVLRSAGLLGTVLALLLTFPDGLLAHLGTTTVTGVVAVVLVVQVLRPDSDLGIVGHGIIVLALSGQADLSVPRALGVGLALLLAHAAFALAATIPAHGLLTGSAWRLGGRRLLPVLALIVLASLLVLALARVALGPWMLVPGILAVVMVFVALSPWADSR